MRIPLAGAFAIKRAAKLTASPSTVYSMRSALPQTPQYARPVETPHRAMRPNFSNAWTMSKQDKTARVASSVCTRGGSP
eukprot:Skav214324  [mRNA]  locus=scaffold86:123357:124766:- [translate_table: standard]